MEPPYSSTRAVMGPEKRSWFGWPYGINSPGAFAFAFNIIYPAYFSGFGDPAEKFMAAYHVALAGNLIAGVLSIALGMMGPQMLTIIPPAALFVPLAGVGFAFLGLEETIASFGAPIVGFPTIVFLFLGWYANVHISWGKFQLPKAIQVILVGAVLGWITGLNKLSDVERAVNTVKWYGPSWTGSEITNNLSYTKDYLGVIFPVAISTVGNSLMSLVSAQAAGDAYPITESMIVDGVGTVVASLFGSPFGTVMYCGHPAFKRSGATTGYSLINGIVYLFLSWFGLLALIRSIVDKAVVGPIVLVVGFMIFEECLHSLPSRHYVALIFGLFPSICDWTTNVTDRAPLIVFMEDGTINNSNLPDSTERWWGILGLKNGAILVSLCWVAILVHIIDLKWWQASGWALTSAIFSAVGIIHVPVAGFEGFAHSAGDNCFPVMDNDGIVITSACWEYGRQWQYMTAYLMMAIVFIIIEALRRVGVVGLNAPIKCPTAGAFKDWYGKEMNATETVEDEKTPSVEDASGFLD